jgi:hypothetical protein
MNKLLRSILLWTVPGFTAWVVLSILNARMYDQAIRDQLILPTNETLQSSIYRFSFIAGAILIASTLLVLGVMWVSKKLRRQNYIALTLSFLIVIGTGISILVIKDLRRKNLEIISDDLSVSLASNALTLEHHFLWGFHLDEQTCSVLWIPKTEFEKIETEIGTDSTWGPFSGETEPVWKECFKNASGFTYHAVIQVKDSTETKLVIGLDPDRQLMIQAYSMKLLPKVQR